MGFSEQEYWSRLPFPSPGDLPDPGIEPRSPSLEADTLTSEPPGKPVYLSVGVLNSLATQKVVCGPAPYASPGTLLKMRALQPPPPLTCSNKPSFQKIRWFPCTVNLRHQQSPINNSREVKTECGYKSNLCFLPLCSVCCYLSIGSHRQKPHSPGQTTVPGAKWPHRHLSLWAIPEDCTQDSKWRQQAVCREAEPGTGSGAWAAPLPRPLENPAPSPSPNEIPAQQPRPLAGVGVAEEHMKNMCSLLPIRWSKNEAFLCCWRKGSVSHSFYWLRWFRAEHLCWGLTQSLGNELSSTTSHNLQLLLCGC